jgi:hypothetical protein
MTCCSGIAVFPWCAHLGTEKTVEMVKRQFYWPGMDADIYAYTAPAVKCQGKTGAAVALL